MTTTTTTTYKNYKKLEELRNKPWSREWLLSLLKIFVATNLLAIGYSLFFIPFKIVPGGMMGLSTVIGHVTGLPVGMLSLSFNIPLLLWGFWVLGNQFGFKTIFAMVSCSVMVDVYIYVLDGFVFAQEMLVSSIFGGVLIGVGVAMTIREGATTGGSDTFARIMHHLTKVPISKLVMAFDSCVVVLGLIIFRDISLAPYAIIAIFVIGRTVDSFLSGFSTKKLLLIISDRHEEIRRFLLKDVDRGGTYLKAEGMYEPVDKKIILSAMTPREVVMLEHFVREIDPNAFMIQLKAAEVAGNGF